MGSSFIHLIRTDSVERIFKPNSLSEDLDKIKQCTHFKWAVVAQTVKCLLTMRETRVASLGWEDPLEKEMATHSSTLAWKIPWMEEHGRLQSMVSQRVGHDWVTSLSLYEIFWHTYALSFIPKYSLLFLFPVNLPCFPAQITTKLIFILSD